MSEADESSSEAARRDLPLRQSVGRLAASLTVGAVYVALAALLVVYFVRFARNVPYQDDWELASVLTGSEPLSLSWFFVMQNEHRVPLLRVLVVLVTWTVGDIRVVMAITIALHALVALAMLWTARQLRGRTAFVDVVFPLVLMTWGHAENFVFLMEFFFVLPSFLVSGIVMTALLDRWDASLRRIVAIGTMLLLLPANGASGVLMTFPIGAWLAGAAIWRWREGRMSRRNALVALGFVASTVVAIGLYMWGFERRGYRPASFDLGASLTTGLEALAIGIGPAAIPWWPWSAVFIAGTVGTGAAVTIFALRRPGERVRSLAVLLGMASIGSAVAGIGFARAGFGDAPGFADRYAVFGATLTAVSCLALVAFARKTSAYALAAVGMVLVSALSTNYAFGESYGTWRAQLADSLVRDAARGMPPATLGKRYAPPLYPRARFLAERLEMARQGRSFFYGSIDEPPCLVREFLPIDVVETHDLRREGDRWVSVGPDPFVVLALPAPRAVCGVDVTFVLDGPVHRPGFLESFWMQTGVNVFEPGTQSDRLPVRIGPAEQTVTVWIGGTIDRLRLDPEGPPSTFELRHLVVRAH